MIEVTHDGTGTEAPTGPHGRPSWPDAAVADWIDIAMRATNDTRTVTWRHGPSGRWLAIRRKPVHECPSWSTRQLTITTAGRQQDRIVDPQLPASLAADINRLEDGAGAKT